jgi:hypothetical protein
MNFTFDPKTHTYRIDGQVVPSVTQILKDVGLINTRFYDDYGADRGSKVHLAVHYYDMGELDEDTLDPALVPYLDGWKKFLKDTGWKVERSEDPIWHQSLLYAGTFDKVMRMSDKEKAVVDVKSGAVEPAVRIQLSAYAEALGGSKLRRYAVQLPGNRHYGLFPFEDKTDRSIWLAALSLYNWRKNNGLIKDPK